MTVCVEPVYLESESDPRDRHFVWAYHIRIENNSPHTVQLCARYWKITDSLGFTQEIEGTGVVGEQPVLEPGESYEYTSGTPLNTPGGIMVGNYTMLGENNTEFIIDIPAFSLDSPHENHALH